MDWARKRMWMVIAVLTAFAISIVLILGFAIFYKTPTCFDTKQNGSETGIDCGGSCSTVCSAEVQPAGVRFARTLSQSGRTDLIAYIDNSNVQAYAKNARITIDVYREDGHVLQRHALVTIPANSSTPVFITNIANTPVQRVFVSFDDGFPVWTKGSGWEKATPKASNISIVGTPDRPILTATITNQTAYPESSVPLVATVFAEDGTVLAASQTIVSIIPAQGASQAVFTWNEPFNAPVARVEVIPLLALPSLVL